jgi:hypothetical protein
MKKHTLDPASAIVEKFGGADMVSEITGVHRTSVYRWMRSKKSGGTGGMIPLKYMGALLKAAKKHDVALDVAEFYAVETPKPKARKKAA